jgi:hypothetical protein
MTWSSPDATSVSYHHVEWLQHVGWSVPYCRKSCIWVRCSFMLNFPIILYLFFKTKNCKCSTCFWCILTSHSSETISIMLFRSFNFFSWWSLDLLMITSDFISYWAKQLNKKRDGCAHDSSNLWVVFFMKKLLLSLRKDCASNWASHLIMKRKRIVRQKAWYFKEDTTGGDCWKESATEQWWRTNA